MSFGMPAPRLEGVDALEEDLTDTESSWALYKEYSSELKVSSMVYASKRGGYHTRLFNAIHLGIPVLCRVYLELLRV